MRSRLSHVLDSKHRQCHAAPANASRGGGGPGRGPFAETSSTPPESAKRQKMRRRRSTDRGGRGRSDAPVAGSGLRHPHQGPCAHPRAHRGDRRGARAGRSGANLRQRRRLRQQSAVLADNCYRPVVDLAPAASWLRVASLSACARPPLQPRARTTSRVSQCLCGMYDIASAAPRTSLPRPSSAIPLPLRADRSGSAQRDCSSWRLNGDHSSFFRYQGVSFRRAGVDGAPSGAAPPGAAPSP